MNDDQRRVTDAVIASLTGEKAFKGRKIVTEVAPYSNYFAAEEYHQDYHKRHGGSCAIPTP
jgi:peptide-methionine (S)-S-oxide reductase